MDDLPDEFVFRIFAPNGRFRVTVPANASLKQMYKCVADTCAFGPLQNFVIYKEPTFRGHIRHTSSSSVNSPDSGLSHGQILYVKFTTEDAEKQAAEALEARLEAAVTAKRNQEVPLSSSSAQAPIPTSSASESDGPKKPKFAAFDACLAATSFNIFELPLSKDYRSKELVSGRPNVIPPTVSLKHQAYRHIDHVEFRNIREMNSFVRYWRYELGMQQPRIGWMFGRFYEDDNYPQGIRAVVEALYETPPSIKENGEADLDGAAADNFFDTALELAATLDLECVGWMFTHRQRKIHLTSSEIRSIARMQLKRASLNHYTGYPVAPFITVTVAPTEDDHIATNAYMVSDLGMAFERDNVFAAEQPEPDQIKIRSPNKFELMTATLENGKNTTSFDPDWLVVRVNDSTPIDAPVGFFIRTDFPVENRIISQTPSDLSRALKGANSKLENWELFSDWHMLLYIARLFDLATAKTICAAVVARTAVDNSLLETFMLL